jgi:hypothetical protein
LVIYHVGKTSDQTRAKSSMQNGCICKASARVSFDFDSDG